MGVRVIGGKNGATVRLQPVAKQSTGDVSSGAIDTETIEHRSIADGSNTDESDNGQQSDSDGEAYTDPASIGSSGDAPFGYTKSGRRRNRAVGSNVGRPRTASTSKTTDSLAAMLFTVHTVAASFVKMPFLIISRDGSKELAEAITTVTELYEVEIVNEKAMAWLNLAGCMARVYVFDPKQKPQQSGPQRVPSQTQAVAMPDFMKTNGSVN